MSQNPHERGPNGSRIGSPWKGAPRTTQPRPPRDPEDHTAGRQPHRSLSYQTRKQKSEKKISDAGKSARHNELKSDVAQGPH